MSLNDLTRQRTPDLDQSSSSSRSTGDQEEFQPVQAQPTPQDSPPESFVDPAVLSPYTFGTHGLEGGQQYGLPPTDQGQQKPRDSFIGVEDPDQFDPQYVLGPDLLQQESTTEVPGLVGHLPDNGFAILNMVGLKSHREQPYALFVALPHTTPSQHSGIPCGPEDVCLKCGLNNPNEFADFDLPSSPDSAMDIDPQQPYDVPASNPPPAKLPLKLLKRLEPTSQSIRVPTKGAGQFACDWCGKAMKRANDLPRHKLAACSKRPLNAERPEKFACQTPGCGYANLRKDKVLLHCRKKDHAF